MLCTGMDERNVLMAMDLVQAKQLVTLLRMVAEFPNCNRMLVDASEIVNRDGFTTTGDSVRTACKAFTEVIGFRTDKCVAKLPEPEPAPIPKEQIN